MGRFRDLSIIVVCALAVELGYALAEDHGGPGAPAAVTVVRQDVDTPGAEASKAGQGPNAEDNPTARDGRGSPSLDNFFRPAAWIFIDGHAGKFVQEGVRLKLPWIIEKPVGSSPKFRVEAFAPLLGSPKDFVCTLETLESANGTSVAYAISTRKGKFSIGTDYSLLSPGDDFVIRNRISGDLVKEIAPLPPGKYVIAAGVINAATGKKGLAMSSFTVRAAGED